ncbi:MAG: ABC transporter ATP-binding protein [bacterium]
MHHMPHTDEIDGKIYDGRLIRRLLSYLKPHLFIFIFALLLLLIVSALELVEPYLVKIGIDTYIKNSDYAGLHIICLIFLIILLIKFLVHFLLNYFTQLMGQRVIKDIRMSLFKHVQSLSLSFFDRYPVGRLMTRIGNDVEVLNEMLSAGILGIVSSSVTLIGIMFIMLWIDVRLTLVSFSILPLVIWGSIIFRNNVRKAFRQIREKIAKLNSFMQENITGIKEVQLFGREKDNLKRFADINGHYRDSYLKAVFYYSLFFPFIEILASVTTALIIWYGGFQTLHGSLTIGVLVAFIEYMGKFFRPIRDLSEKYNLLQSTMASAERIFTLMDTHQTINLSDRSLPLTDLKNEIVFDHVWFAYEQERYVLRDVSFSLKKGENLAIVGATGAGKTSIINLIARFYNHQRGRILIDGKDIRDYNLKELRSGMAMVQQNVFLYSASIMENITLGNTAISMDRIREIANYINADSFIDKLPGKYEQVLTERGDMLSVGQKQLLAFARALAADPSLLILDEATSNVDSETEMLIQDAVRKLVRDRTSIIIAHRLSTITNADQILVLNKGKVVEKGTHASLLKQGGYYKKLYELLESNPHT